jgi:hypothetical protein
MERDSSNIWEYSVGVADLGLELGISLVSIYQLGG